jgi:hypothetical protein
LSSAPKCVQKNYLSNIISICLHLDVPANKNYRITEFTGLWKKFQMLICVNCVIFNTGIRHFISKTEVFSITKTMFDHSLPWHMLRYTLELFVVTFKSRYHLNIHNTNFRSFEITAIFI